MLHTALFALKLIGCILLTLLCTALSLILAVLFVPIKYKAKAFVKNTSKSVKINLGFSWLLCLISGRFIYEGKKTEWGIRIAWKRLPSKKKKKIKASRKTGAAPEKTEGGKKAEKGRDAAASKKEEEGRRGEKEVSEKKKSLKEKSKEKPVRICDIIKEMTGQAYAAAKFPLDDVHKAAFLKLIEEIKKFLPHIKPEKPEGRLCFGFEDPSKTGKAFGCLSMLYPLLGGELEVIPDFNEKRMEADLVLWGRLRVVYVAALALKLIADRNIRVTFSHIRNWSKKP